MQADDQTEPDEDTAALSKIINSYLTVFMILGLDLKCHELEAELETVAAEARLML